MQILSCCCCIVIQLTATVFPQDTITKKNVLTIAPLSLLDGTLSLSYYRIYKQYGEIVVRTRMRLSWVNDPYSAHNEIPGQNTSPSILIDIPFWYYNRLATEAGFSFHFNDIGFVEPTLVTEFGF